MRNKLVKFIRKNLKPTSKSYNDITTDKVFRLKLLKGISELYNKLKLNFINVENDIFYQRVLSKDSLKRKVKESKRVKIF